MPSRFLPIVLSNAISSLGIVSSGLSNGRYCFDKMQLAAILKDCQADDKGMGQQSGVQVYRQPPVAEAPQTIFCK